VNTFDPKRKFSDKERDGETGLDYFGARYYSAPNYSEGHMGRYRWLSIDPVFDTFAVLADPQASNLYSYCRNNPLTLYDPDGRIVICRDRATFEAIKRSIGDDTLADKITWNPVTGTISVEDIETDNQLYESLKTLVGSDSIVRVALVDRAFYETMVGQNYVNKELPLGYGWNGVTIFPKYGRAAIMVHDGNDILIRVARLFFRNDKSEQARTLAEELYGHAYLYIRGLPFQHELPGERGNVNSYINRIRERKY
jgi:RHS repeat-associated protein